eukprot:gene7913-12381_t
MDMYNEMPRYNGSDFFSTDEDELVQMEFQTSDDQMYTKHTGDSFGSDDQISIQKKKKKRKTISMTDLKNNGYENPSDFMKKNEMITLEEFKTLFVNEYQSVFDELLLHDDLLKLYRKDELEDYEYEEKTMKKSTPASKFAKIDKDARLQLRREIGNKFIGVFERDLIPWILADTGLDEPLAILFQDSFQRKLCHSICKFYSLASESFTTKDNERIVVVRKTIDTEDDGILLSSYLKIPLETLDLEDGEISYKILNYSKLSHKKNSKKKNLNNRRK